MKQSASNVLLETAESMLEVPTNVTSRNNEGYPYISQETVLREAFRGFAENLPTNKEKKNATPPS